MSSDRLKKSNRQGDRRKKKRVQRGYLLITVCTLLLVVVLIFKLVDVQIIHHQDNLKAAAALHYQDQVYYPERGEIISADGSRLAVTDYVYTVGITPRDVMNSLGKNDSSDDLAKDLSELLQVDQKEIKKALGQTDRTYIVLKKELQRSDYERLQKYLADRELGGFTLDVSMKRQYPYPELAPELVGFANKREQSIEGVIGLEDQYNDLLAGRPGFNYGEVDNYSKSHLYFSEGMSQQAEAGYNLHVNINADIQRVLEDELDYMSNLVNARYGATGIVLNPRTGAVLAMGQSGGFDPNQPMGKPAGNFDSDTADWQPDQNKEQLDLLTSKVWLNRSISEPYEPGSTYKAFTVAMALEEKAASETELFSDEPIRISGWDEYPVKCSIYPKNHGMETMEQALWFSCNPVMVQLANRLGVERFYKYVKAFGHLEPTGIDLPAEMVGLNHSEPSNVDMAVWSFGEQSTVTPIQLANSFAALANGGVLMRPQVVRSISDSAGRIVKQIAPEEIRQVVSEETAAKTLSYLRGVVTDGTGSSAEVWGYRPGGKTSTASHGENDELVDISFCSVAPYDMPEIVTLIVVYEPTPATTSQPVQFTCSRVTEKALRMLDVKPRYSDEDFEAMAQEKMVQPYGGKSLHDAQINALSNNMRPVLNRGADQSKATEVNVMYQYPQAGESFSGKGFMYLSTTADGNDLPEVTVPDFKGLTAPEVYDVAEQLQLNVHLKSGGKGTVQSQSVAAGEQVKKYSIIDVALAE